MGPKRKKETTTLESKSRKQGTPVKPASTRSSKAKEVVGKQPASKPKQSPASGKSGTRITRTNAVKGGPDDDKATVTVEHKPTGRGRAKTTPVATLPETGTKRGRGKRTREEESLEGTPSKKSKTSNLQDPSGNIQTSSARTRKRGNQNQSVTSQRTEEDVPRARSNRSKATKNTGSNETTTKPKRGVDLSKDSALVTDKKTSSTRVNKVVKEPNVRRKEGKLPLIKSAPKKDIKGQNKVANRKSLCEKDILNLLSNSSPENTDVSDGDNEDGEVEAEKSKGKLKETKRRGKSPKKANKAKSSYLRTKITEYATVDNKSSNRKSSFLEKSTVAQNTSSLNRVPIWKKSLMSTSQVEERRPAQDVFDVDCYGEEEFGPDEDGAKLKKKVRRKKKDTKAILVFGDKTRRKQVEKAVKEIHHLKTPVQPKKKIESSAPQLRVDKSFLRERVVALGYSSDFSMGAQNYFDSVDSLKPPDPYSMNRKTSLENLPLLETTSQKESQEENFPNPADLSQKSYKTPTVPKTFSKLLKNDKSSTPKIETGTQQKKPQTVKEQLKNAFGFDDTDEDMSESESMLISPVGKIQSTMHELSNRNASLLRTSVMQSYREPAVGPLKKLGPYRYNVANINPLTDIASKLKEMEKEKIDQSIAVQLKKHKKKQNSDSVTDQSRIISGTLMPPSRPVRTSPRKNIPSSSINRPVVSESVTETHCQEVTGASTQPVAVCAPDSAPATRTSPRKRTVNSEDQHSAATPVEDYVKHDNASVDPMNAAPDLKNAFQVLKAANQSKSIPIKRVKKLTKKASKYQDLDQSSITMVETSKKKRPDAKKKVAPPGRKNSSDKENAKEAETSGIVVTKTYRKRSEKPSVSFDSSTSTKSHHRPSAKEKKLDAWAALQTSHFSEIDEFDISFI